jgi:hypothetical protein
MPQATLSDAAPTSDAACGQRHPRRGGLCWTEIADEGLVMVAPIVRRVGNDGLSYLRGMIHTKQPALVRIMSHRI